MERRDVFRGALALSCMGVLAALPGQAAARDAMFPPQMTVIVPYPAGSSNDTFARLLGRKLGPALGTTIIVQNKAGASGNIGANFVAKAAPDGATLLVTSSSFTTSAAVDPNLPFNPLTDLVPVAQLAKGPLIVAGSAHKPYKTLSELMSAARASKGTVDFGTSGVGSLSHLANELLNSMMQVQMTHVPYKGISEVITDLVGGRIDMTIASLSSVSAQMKSGTLRGLAVTSAQRSPFAPDLPTVAETLPGYSVEIWWGVFAPAGTPAPVIEKLNTEIRAIVAQPDMRDRFAQEGAAPSQLSSAEFAVAVKSEVERWRKVAQEHGIKAE
jgi:tripartite-type tricarboxylate transporter receptor subunit TctC